MNNCIFCKIANGVVPKEFTYVDKDVMVFSDIHPIKQVHLLVVPKKHIDDFLDLKDSTLFAKIGNVIQTIVKKQKLEKKGYRIVVNGGGAQVIDHLHFHVTGPWGKAAAL